MYKTHKANNEETSMITPEQAKKKASPDTVELQKLEKIIDDALVNGMVSGNKEIHIDASLFPNYATRQSIMNKYTFSGWDVKYKSDQRDGDYLTFKEHSIPPRTYTH